LESILRQRHEQVLAAFSAPAITVNAADQPLAVVVDFDERSMAVEAGLIHATKDDDGCSFPPLREAAQARLTRLALLFPT
jgi:hypothetical protein